eukprot:6627408-Pyramimonas_sp.AAC.1
MTQLGQYPCNSDDYELEADLDSIIVLSAGEAAESSTWATFSVEQWVGLIGQLETPEVSLKSMRDHALVDTAAGQALIGTPDVKNL